MNEPDFELPIKGFVEQLVVGNYQAIIDMSYDKQWQNAEAIANEIKSYPGRITLPPPIAYQNIHVYQYNDGSGYMLEFALWFDNKESDLEIKVDVLKVAGKLRFTLYDIHVP